MAEHANWGALIAGGVLVAATACGSNAGSSPSRDGGSSNAGPGGGGGDDGGSDSSVSFGDDASPFSADAFAGCATDTEQAKQLPLDLYLMVDSSGSMSDLIGPQRSKWSAVADAMTAFVNDSASAGIGVGLQYFPLLTAGVPASCTASSQCGTAGPCFFNACDPGVLQGVVPCDTNADCPRGVQCVPIGTCQYDPNTICPPSAASCGVDANNFPLGACQAQSTSSCAFGDSCSVPDYAAPAVPIALLPGVASAISTSLAAHRPNGNTPTSAALQGAINEAESYARANPGHSVVAVLATDGIPDECTPNTIPAIAGIAASGVGANPSVKTFAIGVFTPNDVASGTAALNQIASSGGSGQAFIINTTSQNVEQQFISALNSIRGAALPCQYVLPVPSVGTPDFKRVNVQFTTGSGAAATLPYVEAPANCDPSKGGWYYDTDPAEGGTPKAILVCPSTCTTLKGDAKGRVDVVLGCQTVVK